MKPIKQEIAPHHADTFPAIAEYFLEERDTLADDTLRRDYFENLDERDFITLVQETASAIRGNTPKQPLYFDGQNAKLHGFEIPDHREKEALLHQVWGTARSILRNRKYDDKEALELAGLVAGEGILLVHPFADGNGRTGRTISYIIENGTNNIEELEPILIAHNGNGGWSIIPDTSVASNFDQGQNSDTTPAINWSHDADLAKLFNVPDAYGGLVSYSTYRDQVIRRLVTEQPDSTVANSAISSVKDGALSGEDFLQKLAKSDRALHYGARIQQLLRAERALFVSDFFSSIHDDKEIEVPEESALRNPTIEQAKRIGDLLVTKIVNSKVTMAEYQVALHRANSTISETDASERQKLLDHKTLNAMVEKVQAGEQLSTQEIFFLYEVDRPISYLVLRKFNALYRDYEDDPRVAFLKQDIATHQKILAEEHGAATAELVTMDPDDIELHLDRFINGKVNLDLLVRKLGALNTAYNIEALQQAGANLNIEAIVEKLEDTQSYIHIARNFAQICKYTHAFKDITPIMGLMNNEMLLDNAANLVASGADIRDIVSRLTPAERTINRRILLQCGATPADLA